MPADMGDDGAGRARGAHRDGRRGRRHADGEVLRGRDAHAGRAGRRPADGRARAGRIFPLLLHVRHPQHRRPAAARRDHRLRAVAGRAAGQGATKGGQEVEVTRRPTAARTRRSSGRPSPTRSPAASRMFRVMSGSLKADTTVYNLTKETPERLGHLVAAAGQDADRRARAQGRRHRRRRQAEGDADQRHAGRQGRRRVRADEVPRAGALLRHRAEEPRRRGQDQHVAAAAAGRGPDHPVRAATRRPRNCCSRARASCTSR